MKKLNAQTLFFRAAAKGDCTGILAAFNLGADRIGLDTLHAIRQRYHRLRHARLPAGALEHPPEQQGLNELETNGIVHLPGFIGNEDREQLRTDFQRFILSLNQKILPFNHPFAKFTAAAKKWDQTISRNAPTWIENLPYVSRWR